MCGERHGGWTCIPLRTTAMSVSFTRGCTPRSTRDRSVTYTQLAKKAEFWSSSFAIDLTARWSVFFSFFVFYFGIVCAFFCIYMDAVEGFLLQLFILIFRTCSYLVVSGRRLINYMHCQMPNMKLSATFWPSSIWRALFFSSTPLVYLFLSYLKTIYNIVLRMWSNKSKVDISIQFHSRYMATNEGF